MCLKLKNSPVFHQIKIFRDKLHMKNCGGAFLEQQGSKKGKLLLSPPVFPNNNRRGKFL